MEWVEWPRWQHKKQNKKAGKGSKGCKKTAKQSGKKAASKLPSVPQLFHINDHVKWEAELKQKRVEEMREKQQTAREQERHRRRTIECYCQDVLRRQKEFEEKEEVLQELNMFPQLDDEATRKAYYKEFRKVVEYSDVILEVLDARDPLGCRCFQMEEAVLRAEGSKKLVLVLNKIDLVPKDIVEKWLDYLRNELPTVAFKASTQHQVKNLVSLCIGVSNLIQGSLGSGLGDSDLSEDLQLFGN
ncbi:guanine nucleotide-binding protein-like 3-like protein isoform X1 [Choloepus didactylus]|uniref:guanine nucleotide-binding protein-like 3-like protein isoform X1 n=1 Tax=Choloepus didactylus TaxID=27675 RepID=UPI00189C9386|nr:guanine nucleotide-binding protein-like 3-like protein isoform X1 [Choloepus didactylus]